ncbi:MerR family DNA-binding protein [Otariodibacter sp.]|uniref:MerR family DNA-binding protein n=1 Tax=Otariodibacter sp. TaxID=3030919 RepID=UPI002620B34E|nr:MerR family DNA-binding protein [Otariodibacter sp.]
MTQFFRKKELSTLTGLLPETIRYYESKGILTPPQRATNGYRLFTHKNLQELHFIKVCRSLGFSIQEIKQLQDLKNHPQKSCHDADSLVAKHLENVELKITQLQEIKQTLLALKNCSNNQVRQCKVLTYLTEE